MLGILAAAHPLQSVAADLAGALSNADHRLGGNLPAGQVGMLAPAALEASGAVVGRVNILNSNVFDLDDPEENKPLFRLANRLHTTTRPDVILQQLLFKPGDPYSTRMLEESERILRANRYIHAASVKPVRHANGVVDVNVETNDVWTLVPRLSLSRSGGSNKTSFGIKEQNLLGSGTSIELLYKSDVDRDSSILKYRDQNLGDSWYGLDFQFANNSDGYSRFLEVEKPFYSLDSRSAQDFSVLSEDSIGTFYDRGEIASEYRAKGAAYEVSRGWSKGLENGWARRLTVGVAYEDRQFFAVDDSDYSLSIVPDDRQLLTPFVGIEVIEDHFEKSSNYDQINLVEDRFLGTRLNARLGVAKAGVGSDRDAWQLSLGAQKGYGISDGHSLLLASNLSSRFEKGGVQNLALEMSAHYYKRQSDRRLLFMGLSVTYGQNLDLDQYLVLGGNTGLRGYPLRFQTGEKRAVFTVEQRYFTDWYPFRLFHVGGAAFFDVGRTWGASPLGASDSQLLKDVGLGLRIGSSRSGLGRVIHIDLAFPLDDTDDIDGVQFLVSTRKSF